MADLPVVLFPARVRGSSALRPRGAAKVRLSADRLEAWELRAGEVVKTTDIVLPSPPEFGSGAWNLYLDGVHITVSRGTGCGCGQKALKRFVPDALS